MSDTSIEWCRGDDGTQGMTWNPTRGCERISPGCENCYAERVAHRFSGPGMPYEGLVRLSKTGEPRWAGEVRFVPGMLAQPLRVRAPRRIFVNSMSDLFHEDVSDDQIAAVFGVMASRPKHTFQILTKRPERMLEWFSKQNPHAVLDRNACLADDALTPFVSAEARARAFASGRGIDVWPLPNVWLGVSVEDTERLARLETLLRLREVVDYRPITLFASLEPLLKYLHIRPWLMPTLVTDEGRRLQHPDRTISGIGGTWRWGLDWVIVGGESGSGARPFHEDWARAIVAACREADVPVFVKQLGSRREVGPLDVPMKLRHRKGADMTEWPEDLRVRMFPGEKWT